MSINLKTNKKMETKFKKDDIVYWQDLQGVVIDVNNSNYPIRVQFNNNYISNFTKDGRFLKDTPIILSHTPYTLNGFTQNSVIEKDTLVWVRDDNGCDWVQMFYSNFKSGTHYCFYDQKTSKETNLKNSWVYLETENPLLKKLTPKNK